jgi:hypothetical protein
MRRLGTLLFVIGVLLVASAPLLRWYVAPALEKAPVDSVTNLILTGEGQTLDRSTGQLRQVSLSGTRDVFARAKASTSDHVVYESYLVVKARPQSGTEATLTKSLQRAAVDRHTGEAVAGTAFDTVDTLPANHKGLVFKFPFHTEQRDYEFFDPRTDKTYPARFVAAEELEGVQVYKYVQDVPRTSVRLNIFDDVNNLQPGFYQNRRTLWVEPTTGLIVKGQEEQQQWLTSNGTDNKIAELRIGYDDATVRKQVEQAQDGAGSLALVRVWLPLAALVLGLILAVTGAAMRLRPARESMRRRDSGSALRSDEPARHAAD